MDERVRRISMPTTSFTGKRRLQLDAIDLLAKNLRDAHVRFVSPGIVIMRPQKADFSKGALISDPDGHAVLLIEK
jgi:hypothetical protein